MLRRRVETAGLIRSYSANAARTDLQWKNLAVVAENSRWQALSHWTSVRSGAVESGLEFIVQVAKPFVMDAKTIVAVTFLRLPPSRKSKMWQNAGWLN